jgi:hypothetical protein
LIKIGAELDGIAMGRFVRLAIEQFIAERHGASVVKSMIKLERLSVGMENLLRTCGQRDRPSPTGAC